MDRKLVIDQMRKDTGCESPVACVQFQRTLWDKYLECRVFVEPSRVFSAMFDDECGAFTTPFAEVKQQEGK